MGHSSVGFYGKGADAYATFTLFKRLLLQKWFRINPDLELEN